MKLAVIGAGYVGLVSAACFAELGNSVVCVEKSAERVAELQKGQSPIFEPGLEVMLKRNLANRRLTFKERIHDALQTTEIVFLCVGTPQQDDGRANLSQVETAAREIAQSLEHSILVVEKSTVPVNTHQLVKRTLQRYRKMEVHADVASNPEFLREGSALNDFMHPDRIVVGVESEGAERAFRELYRPIIDEGHPLLVTGPAEAELIKHAANSFLAMKISYINMIAELCEHTGADVMTVAEGIGLDARIGKRFLRPGIGYGGSCFPKDIRAFITIAEQNGINFGILREAELVNSRRRAHFSQLIEEILWTNKDKVIAVWGLSFKPETDDIRESPAIDIVSTLLEGQATVRLVDPQAMAAFQRQFPPCKSTEYHDDQYEAVKGADALVILTEWPQFCNADWERVRALLRLPIVVDGRNIVEPEVMANMGFEYYSIGRPAITPKERPVK